MKEQDIKKRLNYVSGALEDLNRALKRYNEMDGDEDQKMFYYAAEKKAEEAVESAVNINQDLLFLRLTHVSGSYKDSFKDLSKLKLFSNSDLEKLAETASFRNRLAHDYMEMDEEDTIARMREILKLYPKYLEVVAKSL